MLHKWSLGRVCALVLVSALLFRLGDAVGALRPAQVPAAAAPVADYPLLAYVPPDRAAPLFGPEEAAGLELDNDAGAEFDAAALLTAPVDLADGEGPLVLIVHTHATEAYAESPGHRSEDTSQNVVRVGQALAEALDQHGIEALHYTGLNDLESYSGAYERMETVIRDYLARYPSIRMVIDVHRDSAQDSTGAQVALRGSVAGESAARLLLVMGTDLGGLPHPGWEDNLALALKLQCLGEREAPGLFRPLNLRSARYNQHLCPNSLLLEVGAAGNSLEEALRSATFFAQLIAEVVGQPQVAR